MSTDLLPCPFCGAEASTEANFGREWWVQCKNGHSPGPIHEGPNEAEAEWNRRALPAAPASQAPAVVPSDAQWIDINDQEPPLGLRVLTFSPSEDGGRFEFDVWNLYTPRLEGRFGISVDGTPYHGWANTSNATHWMRPVAAAAPLGVTKEPEQQGDPGA